jgi:hypothetical protein
MKGIDILSMRKTGTGSLDTIALTTGLQGTVPDRIRGFVYGTIGSVSPTTSAIYGGASIIQLSSDEGAGVVTLEVAGLKAQAGWTNMTIDGTKTYTNASSVYTQSGGNTYWQWSDVNPFGSNGSSHTIVFT